MFRTSATNPYDDIVVKATDENLTAENWELIITLCDKVTDEGETGARHVVAAVVKRLAHRNPNVQLYALALAESLTKNCGLELHREIASKSFTQALEKIVADRTTHDKVKRRALGLVAMWTGEFESNPSLGIMEECYTSLKGKGYKFEFPDAAPPVKVDDDLRRKEEEELQRVLEMSMHDKGGHQWSNYLASSNGASGSGSSSALPTTVTPPHHDAKAAEPISSYTTSPGSTARPVASGSSFAPASQPEPNSPTATTPIQTVLPQNTPVTRVRAMHKFQATEPGELAFDKGDVIKVVDRIYKDWWRGQLRGRTGIFPVNYVEPLPDPTPAEIAKEGEQEAAIFAQAANIDRLLAMLRNLDPTKDNLADNEEIQELYRTSMSLRPKIVKLIDRYNQKKAELVSMNDTFIKAKSIFDRMMEESLARHTAEYGPRPYNAEYGPPRQQYVWNAAYDQGPGYPQQFRQSMHPSQPYQQGTSFPPNSFPQTSTPAPTNILGPQPQVSPTPAPDQIAYNPHQQVQPVHHPTNLPLEHDMNGYGASQQPHTVPQAYQADSENLDQQQASAAPQQGPPYDYDPEGQYPDANATAWARYYAQGGKELAGAVYFKRIPGVKEPSPSEVSVLIAPKPSAIHQQVHDVFSSQDIQPTATSPHPSGSFNPSSDLSLHQPHQPHSPTGSQGPMAYPAPSYVYPGRIEGSQQSIDELQGQFATQNLQA